MRSRPERAWRSTSRLAFGSLPVGFGRTGVSANWSDGPRFRWPPILGSLTRERPSLRSPSSDFPGIVGHGPTGAYLPPRRSRLASRLLRWPAEPRRKSRGVPLGRRAIAHRNECQQGRLFHKAVYLYRSDKVSWGPLFGFFGCKTMEPKPEVFVNFNAVVDVDSKKPISEIWLRQDSVNEDTRAA